MKKKLLITMGCSFTEGEGCWDMSLDYKGYFGPLQQDWPILFTQAELDNIFQVNSKRFHELGWPNRVGKKLGFDKVINIGLGGVSNSHQVKEFFEKFINTNAIYPLSDYDVTIIWMMTDPSRISFYKNGKNESESHIKLHNEYEKYIIESDNNEYDYKFDFELESLFYFNIMDFVCKSNNFKLYCTSWIMDIKYGNIFSKICNNESFINDNIYRLPNDIKESSEDSAEIFEKHFSNPICAHPSEHGYEIIANNIVESLLNVNPNIKSTPMSDKMEWIWDGYSILCNSNNFINVLEGIDTFKQSRCNNKPDRGFLEYE